MDIKEPATTSLTLHSVNPPKKRKRAHHRGGRKKRERRLLRIMYEANLAGGCQSINSIEENQNSKPIEKNQDAKPLEGNQNTKPIEENQSTMPVEDYQLSSYFIRLLKECQNSSVTKVNQSPKFVDKAVQCKLISISNGPTSSSNVSENNCFHETNFEGGNKLF